MTTLIIPTLIYLLAVKTHALAPRDPPPKELTLYDKFCEHEPVFKPYLRYYKNRLEAKESFAAESSHPPGFYTDFAKRKSNVGYICVNGLAWLYYKRSSSIYLQPQLHAFLHTCFAPPRKNGSGVNDLQLMAILLMGNRTDYSSPSIQIFNAPTHKIHYDLAADKLVNDEPSTLINASSILIIGDDTECILRKGSKAELRIRSGLVQQGNEPSKLDKEKEGYAGSFCKLSYQHLDSNLKPFNATTKDSEAIDLAIQMLESDKKLRVQGCYVPETYDKRTVDLVQKRYQEVLDLQAKNKELFESNVKGWFNKKGRLPETDAIEGLNGSYFWAVKTWVCMPQEKSNNLPPWLHELLTKPTLLDCIEEDCPPKPKGLKDPKKCATAGCWCGSENLGEIIAYYQTLIKYEEKKSQVDAVKIQRYKGIILMGKISACSHNAYYHHNVLLNSFKDAKEEWKETGDFIKLAVPAGKQLSNSEYLKAARKVTPHISAAESFSLNLTHVFKRTNDSFHHLVAQVKSKDPKLCVLDQDLLHRLPVSGLFTIKRPASLGEYIDPKGQGHSYVSSPHQTCGQLPKLKKACADAKPDAQRAVQLLRTLMESSGAKDWAPADAWRAEVMQLLLDIYAKATGPLIPRSYASSVRRIVKGYLIDYVWGSTPREAAASALASKDCPCFCTVKNPSCKICEDAASCPKQRALNPKGPSWEKIVKELENCRNKPLKISLVEGSKGRYKLLEKEITNKIEAADYEFSFNFAIESFWRIFATVVGLCSSPGSEVTASPLYTQFVADFFTPLEAEWINPRDNAVFGAILGEFVGKKVEAASKAFMEAAFLSSSPKTKRPPRPVKISGGSELNYFK